MSIQLAPLFDPAGRPTYILIAQARQKGPLRALQADLGAADDQLQATDDFRAWWNVAFPTRNPLSDEPIANPDGTGTLAFWQVFR